MIGDTRLLVPATPALLDGWCGPVLAHVYTHPEPCVVVQPVVVGLRGDEEMIHYALHVIEGETFDTAPVEDIRLDLSRAECRDRVARVLAAAVDLDPRAHWRFGAGFQMRAKLETRHWSHVPATVPTGVPCPWDSRMRVYDAPALAGLDPNDDTRLPDGSRWVDALALAAVAREVLR